MPSNATYTLKYESQYPGYQTVTKQVVVGAGNVTQNVAVPVRGDSCSTAPGYVYGSDGVYETFDARTAPSGWTVVDNKGNGQVWRFDNPGNRSTSPAAPANFAIIDSDRYGSGNSQDSSLVSPKVDLTAVAAPVIRFNQDLNYLIGEKADVDLSIDGGATWTNVLRQTADVRGLKEIPIPQAAGQADVQVRFHYYDASYEWWWEVDNVLIGSQVICQPVNGGLVVGHVKDDNTNGYVNGAIVTSDDKPAETATTVATPDDTGLADGYFWLFSSVTGEHPFTAKAANYVSTTSTVDVEADWTTAVNYSLAAGRLAVTPGSVEGTLRMPTGQTTKSFTVTNTGNAPVDVEFGERDGDFEILARRRQQDDPQGHRGVRGRTAAAVGGADLVRVDAERQDGHPAGRGRRTGRPVDGHRQLPGDRDGQPGRHRRRQGLLDRRWQRIGIDRQQLRLRPGHPGLDADRSPAGCTQRHHRRCRRWQDRRHRWLGSLGPGRRDLGLRPGEQRLDRGEGQPGTARCGRSGRPRRQAVRRRWLHDRGLHADVQQRRQLRR